MKPRLSSLAAALAGYAIVSAVMLGPITNFRHLASAVYGGDTRLNVWALAWVDHALLDRAPIFDGNIFFPAPNALAYSEHLLGISPFALPVYALTHNAALTYNIVWLLSYLACGMAAYLLAWRVTRDGLASWIGGLAFAFCFYRMLHGHAHLQLLWACWIPLSLLLLEGWWRAPSWRRIFAFWLVVLLQVLTSWYLAVLILFVDAFFVVWLAWWLTPVREKRTAMAAQFAAAASLGAVIVWPIARRYTFLIGLNGQSPAEALGGAIAWRDLFVPPANTWLGQWMIRHGSEAPAAIWGEKTLYLGFATLGLAALGVAALWPTNGHADPQERRDRMMWLTFMAAVAVIAVMLAFGPSANAIATASFDWTPFGLVSLFPGVSLFRVPARFIQLFTLALAVFAAAGASLLRARFGRTGQIVTLLLVPVMLAEWYLVDFPGGAPQPERVPLIYRQLADIPARAVVSLPEYTGGPEWFTESDYQYYATAHWRPIVNGYSRTEPPGYRERMAAIASFPSRDSAEALRAIGADYVVFHSKRYREGADAKLEAASASTDYALAVRTGPDYLFHVLPARP